MAPTVNKLRSIKCSRNKILRETAVSMQSDQRLKHTDMHGALLELIGPGADACLCAASPPGLLCAVLPGLACAIWDPAAKKKYPAAVPRRCCFQCQTAEV